MGGWRLVADVGGTNVRFARAWEGGRLADRIELGTAGFAEFADALITYLARIGGASGCVSACIGAAGPVKAGEIKLTNGTWTIREAEVSRLLGGVPVRLFNDLQAAALAIPWLNASDLQPVVMPEPAPEPGGARLAVNVGTGFGAAALVPVAGGWLSLASEAGHMTLGATNDVELALKEALHPSAASVEDVLSGSGIVRLYRHFAGKGSVELHSEDVLARVATDPAAQKTCNMFTALLARVTGDLVLATAAWGGVYLFGGVVLGWHAQADASTFRKHFAAKGKMTSRMASVPVFAVSSETAPLIGLARRCGPGGPEGQGSP